MISQAILNLAPNAEFQLQNDDLSTLEWFNSSISRPSDVDIQNEVIRLQAEYDAKEYQRLRSAEYPPITDYLDGIVKGDQAQVDKYIADCQAVKLKYPKGV